MVVLKEKRTVRHIPRVISKAVAFLIKHSGVVSCKVLSAKHRLSSVAEGLEIPCIKTFKAKAAIMQYL